MKTKKYLKQSVFALMLAFVGFSLAPVSALAVDWYGAVDTSGNVSLGVGSSGVFNGGGNGGGWALTNPYGLPSGSILGIASNLLFWLLSIFAILGVVGFVISGIFYLIAAGDEKTMDKGKEGMKWSIMGIIVGLSGFIIMQAVNALLGGGNKTF
ncbi:MAG: hypothetical protein HGA36_01160 [Candidatus Moranbacteria bacterium]|nr:hypothetical protein [Candidatus Moranbacteria bacterium]